MRRVEGDGSVTLASARPHLPAQALFICGAVSQYAGSALAVLLFDRVPASGVAWLRVVSAAVALVAWRRPWRSTWNARRLALVAAFGCVLGLMNLTFYLSIDRLPLGTAVAIEFAGPITVAALGSRTRRDALALVLAVAGVLLLAACLGVGLASSVVPYGLEQLAMRRLPRARFALLLSLLPATAAVMGAVILGQVPSVPEVAGIALVVTASNLRSHTDPREAG